MDREQSVSSVRKSNRRMLAFALAVLLCLSALQLPAFAAESATANAISVVDVKGSVTIKDAGGKVKAYNASRENRIYSGYSVTTGTSSNAWLSLDKEKSVKLDSSTSVEVRKNGAKLEVLVNAGKIYFETAKELDANSALNIRNGTMVCGVRGSYGVVGENEVIMLHGYGTMQCFGNQSGDPVMTDITSGQMMSYDPNQAGSGAGGDLEKMGYEKKDATAADVPLVGAEEVEKSEEKQEQLRQDSRSIDVDELIETIPEKKIEQEKEEAEAAEKKEEQEKLLTGGTTGRISVWSSPGPSPIPYVPTVTSYAIRTAVPAEQGEVFVFVNDTTAAATQARAGDTVLLSVDAKPGYALSALTVTKSDGTAVDCSTDETGLHSFTMPAGDVTVTAAFGELRYTVDTEGYVAAQIRSLTATDAVALTVLDAAGTELAADSEMGPERDLTFPLPSSGVFTLRVDAGMPEQNGALSVTAKLWYAPASGGSETEALCTAAVSGDSCRVTLPVIPADSVIHSLIAYVTVTGDIPTYAVRVSAAGQGTVTASTDSAAAGETVTLTVTPATGFELDTLTVTRGDDPVSVADNAFTMPAGDVTVSARFKPQTFSVTFVDSDGQSVLKAAEAYDYGTAAEDIVQPETPTKAPTETETFRFAGWSPALAPVTQDATYTATYSGAVRTYKIEWRGSEGETLRTDELEYHAAPSYGDAPARDGWRFAGWRGGETLYPAGGTLPAVERDADYQAEYVRLYAITTPGDANYTVTALVGAEETPFAAADDRVVLRPAAKPGYGLETDPPVIRYELDGAQQSATATREGDDFVFAMPAASVTVYVAVSPNRHTVTLPADVANGTVTVRDKTADANNAVEAGYGEEVTLILTGRSTTTPPPDWSLSTVRVEANGGGEVEGQLGDETTGREGDDVFLRRTYTFRMPDDDVTVSAAFAQKTYRLTVAEGISGGSVSVDEAEKPQGERYEITVTPDADKELERLWLTDRDGNEIPETTFAYDGVWYLDVPTRDTTLHAAFREKTYGIFYATPSQGSMAATADGKLYADFGDPGSVRAPAGATVTLILTGPETPENTEPPYAVRTVTVTDGDGAIELTTVTNGYYQANTVEESGSEMTYHAYASTYSFTMPASDVTVNAEYRCGYFVRFDANGGGGMMADDFAETSPESPTAYYELPECTFTPPGSKVFGGWQVGETVCAVGDTCSGRGGDIICRAMWYDMT